MEIWVFPNLTGILRLFFKHGKSTIVEKVIKNRVRKSLRFRTLKENWLHISHIKYTMFFYLRLFT